MGGRNGDRVVPVRPPKASERKLTPTLCRRNGIATPAQRDQERNGPGLVVENLAPLRCFPDDRWDAPYRKRAEPGGNVAALIRAVKLT